MEGILLKDFIENTLVNVAEGIRNANKRLKEDKTISDSLFNLRPNKGDYAKIPGIQFDVAVTATKQGKDKSGFVVALINLGGGATIEHSSGNEMMQRIKFEVGLDSYFA